MRDTSGETIRPYRSTDEEQIVDLWRACELIVPWNDPQEDIALKTAFQPDLFLVAARGDRVVGSVMAGYDGHRGWINYLAVGPSDRRRGLGRRLVEAAERALAALGCPKINLQVRASNRAVVEFYERLGFRREETLSLGKRLDGKAWPPGSDED